MGVEDDNLSLFSNKNEIPVEQLNRVDNFYRMFSTIHNFIYANDGLSPQEALNEFIKILFIKINAENKKSHDFHISSSELDRSRSNSLSGFNSRIYSLFSQAKDEYPTLFDKSEKIKLKTSTLAFVVSSLQDVQLSGSDNDVKGIAFQKFIFSSQRGDRGQFFTPDPVIKMCVEILNPTPKDRILDPAAGTGGFLIETMRYLSRKYAHDSKPHSVAENLYGIEISPTVARLAKMKMILEGDGGTGIINSDSLASPVTLSRDFAHQADNWPTEQSAKEAFDLILTNPPFGTQGKITNPQTLKDFDLAHKWSKDGEAISSTLLNGQVPEILFIERCLYFLKPGGRMAIVLPNGELENPSLVYVRKYIRNIADLIAVVSLPQETFIPHGTGVKASVLIIQKKSSLKVAAPSIYFARINKIGYKGDKNGTALYKKDANGKLLTNKKGNYVIDEDITDLVEKFNQFTKTGKPIKEDSVFTLLPSKLGDRFDFDFYNPDYLETLDKLSANNAVRLGDVADILKTRSPKLKSQSSEISYIELSDINSAGGEIVSAEKMKVFEAPSRATYEIMAGDVITAVAGNSVGTSRHATAIVGKPFEGAICTNGFRVFKPKKVTAEYLFLFMKSTIFLRQMFQLRTGAAIPSVSDKDLSNILIPLVSSKEQARLSKQVQESMVLRGQADELLKESSLSILK